MDRIHCILIATGVGAAVGVGVVVAVPIIIACLGFTARGIARGSVASSMMSYSAISNGGGVSSGGLVATLQSIDYVAHSGHAPSMTISDPSMIFKRANLQGMVGDAVIATVAALISNYTV